VLPGAIPKPGVNQTTAPHTTPVPRCREGRRPPFAEGARPPLGARAGWWRWHFRSRDATTLAAR
jgi:hypothetical protein